MKIFKLSIHTKLYINLSLLGLAFLLIAYLYSPRLFNPYKYYVLIIFVVVCLLGTLAAVYPTNCLRLFNIHSVDEYRCIDMHVKSRGHHPDCGKFKNHTYLFNNKSYCVGCSGLFIGGLLAVLTCVLYLIYDAGGFVFWAGFILVLASFILSIFLYIDDKWLKFLVNLSLVWGSALILTGILDGYLFLSLYFILLVVTWIFTRTEISRVKHDLICQECILNKKGNKKESKI